MKKTKSGRRGQGFGKSAKVYGWVRKRLTTDDTFEKGPEVSEGEKPCASPGWISRKKEHAAKRS